MMMLLFDLASFRSCPYLVINELKRIGYDIRRHDCDCEVERQGGDYVRQETAERLSLTTTYPDG